LDDFVGKALEGWWLVVVETLVIGVAGHHDGLFLDRRPSTLAGVGNGVCVSHGRRHLRH
jgi:hypothetical protein